MSLGLPRAFALFVVLFPVAIAIELACYLLAPAVALFVTTRPRQDRVKRLGNQTLTLDRDYLITPLAWFQTHDNAVDEFWYGLFNADSIFPWLRRATQADYERSRWLRYACRVLWLWRNCAYGFHYHLLGRPLDLPERVIEAGVKESGGLWYRLTIRQSSWQVRFQAPIAGSIYLDLNFGWKAHTGFPRCMYANRVIGFGRIHD